MLIKLSVSVVVEPDEPGFHAYCPAFKGLHVAGDTAEEALENAKDAVLAYLESYAKNGDPLPIGPHLTVQDQEEEKEKLRVPPEAALYQLTVECPTESTFGIR